MTVSDSNPSTAPTTGFTPEMLATLWPRHSKHVQVEPGGAYASYRVWVSLLIVVLGGGTGYTGWRFVTEAQVDEAIAKHEKRVEANQTGLRETVDKNTTAIVEVTAKIENVQAVQHLDIAHREARRVVDEAISCRRNDNGCEDERAQERERIRRRNMSRLKKGAAPCSSLACN